MYKQNNIAGAAGIALIILSFSANFESDSRYSWTNDELNTIMNQTNDAFDLAERTVFKNKPDDPDDPVGPHPDAEKCACRGTGKITHGDGHQTDCPYHGKTTEPEPEPEPESKPESSRKSCKCDTGRTYCNCKNAYGKCSCKQT